MSWPLRIAALSRGVGATPPDPPFGFVYITDDDGAFLRADDGAYLITEA